MALERTWMADRDAAVIGMVASFGKRAGENVTLTKRDLWQDQGRVFVRFTVTKVAKPVRKRCSCGIVNKASWSYCRGCGASLATAEIVPSQKVNRIRVKSRVETYPMLSFILKWWQQIPDVPAYIGLEAQPMWAFPPARYQGFLAASSPPDWSRHLDRRGPGNILSHYEKKYGLAVHWWPHLFRHVLSVKFAEAGNDEFDLMDWFDWERYETAKRYTKLGGGRRIKRMGDSML
jgi:hypothetical protein